MTKYFAFSYTIFLSSQTQHFCLFRDEKFGLSWTQYECFFQNRLSLEISVSLSLTTCQFYKQTLRISTLVFIFIFLITVLAQHNKLVLFEFIKFFMHVSLDPNRKFNDLKSRFIVHINHAIIIIK